MDIVAFENGGVQRVEIAGTSIKIDAVAMMFGGIDGSVTVDHQLAVVVGCLKPSGANPDQVVLDLVFDGDTFAQARMDENMVVCDMHVR